MFAFGDVSALRVDDPNLSPWTDGCCGREPHLARLAGKAAGSSCRLFQRPSCPVVSHAPLSRFFAVQGGPYPFPIPGFLLP